MNEIFSNTLDWLRRQEHQEQNNLQENDVEVTRPTHFRNTVSYPRWVAYYFGLGAFVSGGLGVAMSMSFVNISSLSPLQSIKFSFIWILQFILTSFVSELPLSFVLNATNKTDSLPPPAQPLPTVILNYNIKANSEEEIDECFANLLSTLSLNDADNVYAVVVSSTRNETLMNAELAKVREMVAKYPKRFHYLYRTSSFLKKCGQYQDLMLFVRNYTTSYSYSDIRFGSKRRPEESLFDLTKSSENVSILRGISAKYILVLDSDNIMTSGLQTLLSVAENNPEFCIFQPSIFIHGEKTLYQYIFSTLGNLMTRWKEVIFLKFNHCSFFGKGLINIDHYIARIISHDLIPIDAMSHDTFESMFVPCKYVKQIQILETFPTNHCAWSIREERWNVGDLQVLFHHLARRNKTWNFQKSFFALSPSRVISARPILLIYILLLASVTSSEWSILSSAWSFLFCFLSTSTCFLLFNSVYSKKRIVFSICASLLFYMPEVVTGSFRLLKSLKNTCHSGGSWIPSSLVEQRLQEAGLFKSSLNEFWTSQIVGCTMLYFFKFNFLVSMVALPLTLLPLTSFITSLAPCCPKLRFIYPDLQCEPSQ